MIVDEGGSKSLPLPAGYKFLESHGLGTEAALLRTSIPGKDTWKRRAKRGMCLDILRTKGLFEKFVSEEWPFAKTDEGKKKVARYDKCYLEWKNSAGDAPEDDSGDSSTQADQFAYESDLRDFLAKNPSLLELGMTLWPVADGQTATEFRIDDNGRRIDILARDGDGVPVVIELKVSSGHEKTIGQALYYRGCVKQKLSVPKVRTMIVAREITSELRIATKDLDNVELFEYRLAMTLKKV